MDGNAGAQILITFFDGRESMALDVSEHEAMSIIEGRIVASRLVRRPSIEEMRERHPRAYEPWSTDEERKLVELHDRRLAVREIAAELGRQPGAVRARLDRLGRT